jgi:hypothetical protein
VPARYIDIYPEPRNNGGPNVADLLLGNEESVDSDLSSSGAMSARLITVICCSGLFLLLVLTLILLDLIFGIIYEAGPHNVCRTWVDAYLFKMMWTEVATLIIVILVSRLLLRQLNRRLSP